MFSRVTTESLSTNYDTTEEVEEDDNVLSTSTNNLVQNIDLDLEISEIPTRKKKLKKLATSIKFPYCYIYIAWFSLVLVCVTCSFFVVLYGLQFGKDVSARWLSAMTISFVQDVIISEPLKVFAIATVVALIIKKPQTFDREEEQDKDFVDYEQWTNNKKESSITLSPNVKPPDKKELKKAREKRLKELKMSSLLKELVLYVLFIVCLSAVTYNNKNPMSFQVNKVMTDIFVRRADNQGKSFEQIFDIDGFYSWLNTTLLPGIYSSTLWYNHQMYHEGTGTIALGSLYLIDKTRIRQTRVKKNSCSVPKCFNKRIKQCHGSYSETNKDTKCYRVGWIPIANSSLCNPTSSLDPWMYLSSSHNSKLISSQHGDGFMFDLSRTEQIKSSERITLLRSNNWIDERTREIIIKFNVYSGPLNLFGLGKLAIKLHPTNGITKHSTFMVTKLFALSGVLDSYAVVSHLFIFLFFLILAYREAKQLYRLKRQYFASFWNCLQFLIIVLTTSCISIFFVRLLKIEQLMTSLEQRDVISFDHVASIDMVFGHVIAMIVFFSWLCVIKLLRFNRRLLFLQETLRRIVKPMKAFSVVFLTLFVAYLHTGYLMFSRNLATYHDLPTAFVSLSSLFMGHLDFTTFEGSDRLLGPTFLFIVMFFGVFIFMNLFIALILESFMTVKMDASKMENEYEFLEFIFGQLRVWVGMNSRAQPPTDVQLAPKLTHSEKDADGGKKRLENVEDVSMVFGETDESVSSLVNMFESISKDDWVEEMTLYKLFLWRQRGLAWSRENEEFAEFWKELDAIPGRFGEVKPRVKSRDEMGANEVVTHGDRIELTDFEVIVEDDHF